MQNKGESGARLGPHSIGGTRHLLEHNTRFFFCLNHQNSGKNLGLPVAIGRAQWGVLSGTFSGGRRPQKARVCMAKWKREARSGRLHSDSGWYLGGRDRAVENCQIFDQFFDFLGWSKILGWSKHQTSRCRRIARVFLIQWFECSAFDSQQQTKAPRISRSSARCGHHVATG